MNVAAKTALVDAEIVGERKDTALTRQPASGPLSPMEMVQYAIQSGQPIDVVREMVALAKEIKQERAREAFTEAFAAFKSEAITIVRNKKVTDGPLKGKSYAELFSFVDAVTPALSKHGLSASWNITRDEKDWIEVTCTIEHVLGHAKRVPMGGPPDTGGAKNPIQARASTVTYLERHTLKAACGLAEQGDDTDGAGKRAEAPERINAKQLERLQRLLEESKSDTQAFCQMGKIDALPDMLARDFDDAVRLLEARKAKMGQK